MILKYKYSIGTHVMFYEIEMFKDFISGLINLMESVDNKENVYIDFAFNLSQFFETIDVSKITKAELTSVFETQIDRLNGFVDKSKLSVRIIDNDNEFYTQTDYRREYNSKFCKWVDFVMWGETDSFFPKQTFACLDILGDYSREVGVNRFVACFADRKMWDDSWDATVHPKFLNHKFIESDYENKNQAKSTLSIEEMNAINSEIKELDLTHINYPKIDGSCLVLSSDFIRAGINIPPCFIHNDDESLSLIAKKMLGEQYCQFIFKNVLKVHARRHPKKRMYILNEDNPNGFCNDKKGAWWKRFIQMSQHNVSILIGTQGKFFTFEDFKKNK
jgi:hypothetical protein